MVATAITNPYFRQSVDETKRWCMRLESKKYRRDIELAAGLAAEVRALLGAAEPPGAL